MRRGWPPGWRDIIPGQGPWGEKPDSVVRGRAPGRYKELDLVAIFIPGYHRRLMDLEALNKELLGEIEIEGMKGASRDMRFLQKKHLERQDLLAEYAFLSHFRDFVEKW